MRRKEVKIEKWETEEENTREKKQRGRNTETERE